MRNISNVTELGTRLEEKLNLSEALVNNLTKTTKVSVSALLDGDNNIDRTMVRFAEFAKKQANKEKETRQLINNQLAEVGLNEALQAA